MFFVVGVQFHVVEQIVVEMLVLLIGQQVLALISVEYFNRHDGSVLSGMDKLVYVLIMFGLLCVAVMSVS